MATAALVTMGEEGAVLAERITYGMDTESNERFGLRGVAGLDYLAESIGNNATPNEIRWGAAALLGALSLAYDVHAQAPEHQSLSSQAIAATAQELLLRIHLESGESQDVPMHDFTGALLTAPRKSPDDIALELLELPDRVAEQFKKRGITQTDEPAAETNTVDESLQDNRTVGEPVLTRAAELGLNAAALAKMQWLSLEGVTDYHVRPVRCRDKVVAYAVDLTPFNSKVAEAAQEVVGNSDVAETTLNRLGSAVIQYAHGASVPSVRGKCLVPTLYSKNIGANSRLTRAYFTPLGRQPDGLPIVGIIGLALGKQSQSVVLRTITGQKRAFRSGNID